MSVNHALKHDEELKKKINVRLDKMGYQIKADREVKHLAQVLGYDIGPAEIATKIKRKAKLKIAVHYGYHSSRCWN